MLYSPLNTTAQAHRHRGVDSIRTLNEIISVGVSSKLVYGQCCPISIPIPFCLTSVPPSEGPVCESYPCLNDGLCVETPSPSGYLCLCSEFFTGVTCQLRTFAWANCSNPLVCKAEDESVSQCTSLTSNPCLNGGTCLSVLQAGGSNESSGTSVILNQRCLCPPGYHGLLCELGSRWVNATAMGRESDFDYSISEDTAEWPVLSILLLLAVVIFVAAAVIFCYSE